MSELRINTRRHDFRMVDEISAVDGKHIKGLTSPDGLPVSMAIECLAQLGALHARFLTAFKKHCFLLVIERLDIMEASAPKGALELDGLLIARTGRAFSYALQALSGEQVLLDGQLVFASVDYDDNFKRERLKSHYQRIFTCLTRGFTTGSR